MPAKGFYVQRQKKYITCNTKRGENRLLTENLMFRFSCVLPPNWAERSRDLILETRLSKGGLAYAFVSRKEACLLSPSVAPPPPPNKIILAVQLGTPIFNNLKNQSSIIRHVLKNPFPFFEPFRARLPSKF
jgi:hypothetical protein